MCITYKWMQPNFLASRGVLMQFPSLICNTYKWIQPNFLVAMGVMKFPSMISTTCKCMQSNQDMWPKRTCFLNPQIETNPKPPTSKHIEIPLYYTQSCLHHVYKFPYVSTLKCNHSWNTFNPLRHWTSLMHHLTFMNHQSSTQWTNANLGSLYIMKVD